MCWLSIVVWKTMTRRNLHRMTLTQVRHVAWIDRQYRARYKWLIHFCDVLTSKCPYIIKRLRYIIFAQPRTTMHETNRVCWVTTEHPFVGPVFFKLALQYKARSSRRLAPSVGARCLEVDGEIKGAYYIEARYGSLGKQVNAMRIQQAEFHFTVQFPRGVTLL
jgi:hypothetical protein